MNHKKVAWEAISLNRSFLISSRCAFAGIHGIHFGRYHRLLSKRFPFAVYYRLVDDEVRVYAVLDCRRNPAWVRKRLQ